jgi:four helix bundle protein
MQVQDLSVYNKLFNLSLEVSRLTMNFPSFELYELGSQLRRSSNSPGANLAEGFDNKHTNIFTECINRAQAEIRETLHHLRIAFSKNYIDEKRLSYFTVEYETCSKMLFGLDRSLKNKHKV